MLCLGDGGLLAVERLGLRVELLGLGIERLGLRVDGRRLVLQPRRQGRNPLCQGGQGVGLGGAVTRGLLHRCGLPKLKALPAALTKSGPRAQLLGHLLALTLRGNSLFTLPPGRDECFGCLRQLERLDLSENFLQALPPSVGVLARLQRLDLSENKLTSLPHELGDGCTSLRSLLLFKNELSLLPGSLGRLQRLARLDVNNNRLIRLPEQLSGCTLLQGATLGQQVHHLAADPGRPIASASLCGEVLPNPNPNPNPNPKSNPNPNPNPNQGEWQGTCAWRVAWSGLGETKLTLEALYLPCISPISLLDLP